MTNFTKADLYAALSAIASGTLTKCSERGYNGMLHTLYKEGYISGEVQPHLNGFVLTDILLTALGQQRHQSTLCVPN